MSYYLYKLGTVSLVSSCLLNLLIVSSSEAQITPDSSLGNENSIVTPNVTVKDALADLIEGGAIRDNNLLHSFEQFNVSDGGRVYFASPDGIANILTRVTGTNISEIFGVLGVDGAANLFLLNPNGIIFGENAALDVNGSFIATTADSYIFDNGFAYSASNPEAPPLLTINIPVGLQVGNNPGAIEVKGTGHNLTFEPFPFSINRDLRPKGLEVNSGNTLALIGGEINLTQGNLTAEQGRIELGSVETGSVSIIPSEDGFSFDYEAITDFQDINITQASSIDVSGNGSGNLQLQGKNISLLENSAIISSTIGAENGGDIKIAATDSVNIIGTQEGLFPSAIFKNIESGATGNNGDINIETRQLEISKNAFISNSVIGDGNGGNIEIIANQIKITDNPLTQGYSTGLFADSLGEKGNSGDISISASVVSVSEQGLIGLNNLSQGKVGNLTIIADNLLLQDGGIISSFQLNSSGDGGNISLTANNIELGGESNEGNSSLIFGSNINVDTDNSRSFKITADNLLVKDDAQISLANVASFTENNLEIKVKRLTIENSKIDIFNSAGGDDGGMIDIEAANLSISAGVIETSTFGEGNSANISIRADNLEIQGNNEGKFGGTGGIRSSVFEATRNPSGLDFNGGNGGNIDIIANNLTLINGGFISASTFGQGKAGNINIQAKNINVTGAIFEEVRTLTSDFFEEPTFDVELKLFSSSISTLSEGDSDAGTININTDTLNVTDRGNISVSSLGKGNSGNLNITATELNLDDSAIIEAKVNTGNRGNIN
ncbi:filamentous hemagglutinin N-terminal domain-containing protein, partial [Hyella patelloides]|uniref:two-partner secretion domain-containing protein n=1 Tax=Hyella patelloides TaxID=1982969 RepID=UPI0011A428D5